MENFFLEAVVDDLRPRVVGASVGRVWQPEETLLVVDLRLDDGRFLAVSVAPTGPALYLTARAIGAVEKRGAPDRAFAALVRKRLRGATVDAVEKPPNDRVVTFEMSGFGPGGERETSRLVVELTGRTANAYLVDADGAILGAMRAHPRGATAGDAYVAPTPDARPLLTDLDREARERLGPTAQDAAAALAGFGPTLAAELEARARAKGLGGALASLATDLSRPAREARLYELARPAGAKLVLATFALASAGEAPFEIFDDPSAAADARFDRMRRRSTLDVSRSALVARARAALARLDRANDALRADLAATEGSDRDREIAESLLAQVGSAREVPGGLEITDLYDPDGASIVVAADRGETPQAVAERLFARHRKARRTVAAVAERQRSLDALRARLGEILERAVAAATDDAVDTVGRDLDAALGVRRVESPRGERAAKAPTVTGARRFVSSDGYEILVGRSSAGNDAITFKIARPSDVWLHAADYPGSHVVVRNLGRGEVPHRTVAEAAQLAAFYSDARDDSIVDVRYTPRRFVTKPKNAPPGLVRLGRFKTIAVRPSADIDRAS